MPTQSSMLVGEVVLEGNLVGINEGGKGRGKRGGGGGLGGSKNVRCP